MYNGNLNDIGVIIKRVIFNWIIAHTNVLCHSIIRNIEKKLGK